jgi:hypothetical protein
MGRWKQKSALRRMREEFGAGDEAEPLRLALTAMVAGYDRTIAAMPTRSLAASLVDGAFGSAPKLARMLLEGE